jgi:glycosyltransferase involved in cell wall biosynthesis
MAFDPATATGGSTLTGTKPSVVVRAKNKEETIELALAGLRSQTIETEIILVDSGSTDRTVEIARPYCDEIVAITAEAFSYGGALNLGAQRSTGEIVFALSAHCAPPGPNWVEQSLEAYADDQVAGTFGYRCGPDGTLLASPTKFGLADLPAGPTWGFTNHGSSWRRRVWERFPFDEQLISCEDKEWMWRVLAAGLCIVADPRLIVEGSHRRRAGLRALYKRVHREHLVLSELLDYPRLSGPTLLRRWWSDFPEPSSYSNWQRRFSPMRSVELLGEFTGDLSGSRRRGDQTRAISSWEKAPGPTTGKVA